MTEYIEKGKIKKMCADLFFAKSQLAKSRKHGAWVAGDLLPEAELTVVELFGLIMAMPADDVVKVVRCKDCTYYEGDCCGFWEEYPKTEKNDFCSNGKKRAK